MIDGPIEQLRGRFAPSNRRPGGASEGIQRGSIFLVIIWEIVDDLQGKQRRHWQSQQ
jgi:hypothetical protein